jgi:type I restriction enzyme S subunit
MSAAETLITEHLDTWTSAIKAKPSAGRGGGKKEDFYGIKKLRELILELAVRGLLVPQDPNDEPASKILKEIKTRRDQLVRSGELKKQKPLPPISAEETPLQLPEQWEWARFGGLGLVGSSSRVHQKDWTDAGVPFLRAREIIVLSKKGKVDNELFITEELFERLSKDGLVPEEGDLMITGVGSIGVPYVVKSEDHFYFKDASVLIFKNLFRLYPRYLHVVLTSPYWIGTIHEDSMGTTVHTLTISRANIVLVPLPPLAEQRRIVAKVDELMALCDQLEQQQEDSVRTHATLVQTLLGALTAAGERGQFEQAWQRIASHFDTLITTESSIDQLKQTILQLAVMGKLAPRGTKDGSALPVSIEKLVGRKNLKNGLSLSPLNGPSDFVVLPLSAMKGDTIDCSEGKPIEVEVDRAEPFLIKEGDVFIIRGNGSKERVGVAGMARSCPPNVLFPDLFIRVPLPPERIDSNYFLIAWNSPATRERLESLATTTSGIWKVNQGHISECSIPLPPLAEQRQIVARVNELNALCDRLKANLQNAQATQLHLADSLVEAAIH